VEVERLTGVLGQVCRACDAYNEPGTRACVSCGAVLPASELPRGGAILPEPGPGPLDLGPILGAAAPDVPLDLPPLDLSAAPPPPASAPAVAPPPPPPPAGGVPGGFPPGLLFEAPELEPFPVDAPAPAPPPRSLGETQPMLLLVRCPGCGVEVPGEWCPRCGQAIDPERTRAMAASPRAAPFSPPPAAEESPPAPGAPPRARLVLERGDGTEGTSFPLGSPEQGAGRTRGTLVFPEDPCLDPLHATFLFRDDVLLVRDEGSAGGTFLRLRGLTVPLRAGDLFAVGDRLLRFAGPLAPPSPPSPDGTRRLGSPRPAGTAVLVEERLQGGAAGRVWLRPGPSISLGRAGCSINLGDDPYLSQAHAEIVVDPDGTARLRDLGSSNGTFVRLPAHAERELRDGDVVRMGQEVLRVVSNPG
jgi:hypothetical protein